VRTSRECGIRLSAGKLKHSAQNAELVLGIDAEPVEKLRASVRFSVFDGYLYKGPFASPCEVIYGYYAEERLVFGWSEEAISLAKQARMLSAKT